MQVILISISIPAPLDFFSPPPSKPIVTGIRTQNYEIERLAFYPLNYRAVNVIYAEVKLKIYLVKVAIVH